MGGLCGRASRADRRERERRAERAVDVGKVERRTGVSAIASDFLKDVGLQKPDTEYYSRMRERREAAQTEQARLREKEVGIVEEKEQLQKLHQKRQLPQLLQ